MKNLIVFLVLAFVCLSYCEYHGNMQAFGYDPKNPKGGFNCYLSCTSDLKVPGKYKNPSIKVRMSSSAHVKLCGDIKNKYSKCNCLRKGIQFWNSLLKSHSSIGNSSIKPVINTAVPYTKPNPKTPKPDVPTKKKSRRRRSRRRSRRRRRNNRRRRSRRRRTRKKRKSKGKGKKKLRSRRRRRRRRRNRGWGATTLSMSSKKPSLEDLSIYYKARCEILSNQQRTAEPINNKWTAPTKKVFKRSIRKSTLSWVQTHEKIHSHKWKYKDFKLKGHKYFKKRLWWKKHLNKKWKKHYQYIYSLNDEGHIVKVVSKKSL